MECPHCGYDLGDGMLPARCPKCGENLANRSDAPGSHEGARRAAESRSKVEGLVDDAGHERPRRLRFLVGIVIVLAFVCGLVYLAWTSELLGGVTVPDVVGWRAERAQSDLEDSGFAVQVVAQKDDGQAGFVLSVDPDVSTRLPKGSTVTLNVSQSRTMPDVTGMTAEEAKKAIEAEGVTASVTEQASDQPAGTLLSASATAGDVLKSTDTVTLVVARSPLVPTIMGLTEADATTALTAEGLAIHVTYVIAGEGQTSGTVVAVDPAEGTDVASGSTVEVSVANDLVRTIKDNATKIAQVVYNCAPLTQGDGYIGSNLRPYLSASLNLGSASDHDVWYSLVKHWTVVDVAGDAFQSLPRSLVGTPEVSVDSSGNASVVITVLWDWSPLGDSYAGVTSQDTRTITMSFDEQGLLTAFSDPQTDVPLYKVVS